MSQNPNISPPAFKLYIYSLPPDSKLRVNLHLSRDDQWTKASSSPTGHQTINSLYGDPTGTRYLQRLKELDTLMGHWTLCIEYDLGRVLEVNVVKMNGYVRERLQRCCTKRVIVKNEEVKLNRSQSFLNYDT
jgi:hypothetical protein